MTANAHGCHRDAPLAVCSQRTADDSQAAQLTLCRLHHDALSAVPGTIIGTLRLLEVSSTSREDRYVVRRHPYQGEEIIVNAFQYLVRHCAVTLLYGEWLYAHHNCARILT
jgi:hypothetical protein